MSTTGHLTYTIFPSDGSKLIQRINVDPTIDGPVQNVTKDTCKVVIEDARGKEDQYTLDTTGFQFLRRPSKHTRFQDDKEIKAEYYPECMEIIKQLTGATRVIPFHHCMLSTCLLIQSSTYPRYPGSYPSPKSRWSRTPSAFIINPCRFHYCICHYLTPQPFSR